MFPFEWIDTETIDKWYIQESGLYSQRSYSLAVEYINAYHSKVAMLCFKYSHI